MEKRPAMPYLLRVCPMMPPCTRSSTATSLQGQRGKQRQGRCQLWLLWQLSAPPRVRMAGKAKHGRTWGRQTWLHTQPPAPPPPAEWATRWH